MLNHYCKCLSLLVCLLTIGLISGCATGYRSVSKMSTLGYQEGFTEYESSRDASIGTATFGYAFYYPRSYYFETYHPYRSFSYGRYYPYYRPYMLGRRGGYYYRTPY